MRERQQEKTRKEKEETGGEEKKGEGRNEKKGRFHSQNIFYFLLRTDVVCQGLELSTGQREIVA